MGFILNQARSQMREWASDPDRAAQIARTPGATELLEKLQADNGLMQALLDSRPGIFGPDADAIKADMQEFLDYADGKPGGIKSLLEAYEIDPDAVKNAVINRDSVAIKSYIDEGSRLALKEVPKAPDAENSQSEMSNTVGSVSQDVSTIEGLEQTALVVADNAPGMARGAVVMEAATNFLEAVQSLMSGSGGMLAEEVAELGQNLTNVLQNSNIELFSQIGDSMEDMLSRFNEEQGVQLVAENPAHGADGQVGYGTDLVSSRGADWNSGPVGMG